jgi:NADH dehydrogenase/NADH:ubiquinone oxidoreductase subunit G
VKIIIDGKECEAEYGEYILQIARKNNIYIPTLCHSDALPGLGSCRLCVVEVIDRGWSKVVTSCIFPITKEVEVLTNSKRIKNIRKDLIMFLKARCTENEEVRKLAKAFEVEEERVNRFKENYSEDCVLCGLCVKSCEEIGAGAISTVNRGIFKKVATPYDEPSKECIGCATCANICPTNAIKVVDKDGQREIWSKKFNLVECEECGKYFATEEHLKYAYRRAGIKSEKILCEKCKRKASLDEIRNIYI